MRALAFIFCFALAPSAALACTYEAASPERDRADIATQQALARDSDVIFLGRVTGLELTDEREGLRVSFRPVLPHFQIKGGNPPREISLRRYLCIRAAPGDLEERAVVYAKHRADGTWEALGAVSLREVLDPAIREAALATDGQQRQWELDDDATASPPIFPPEVAPVPDRRRLSPTWTWLGAASALSLLLGILIGRATRAPRNNQRKKQ